MPELEMRCEVSLWEPIALATQANTDYQPIQWILKSGSRVVVRMDVAEETAKSHYAEHSSTPNYFVNTPVHKLFLSLKVADVSDLDLSRLLGKNGSEKTFHAHFESSSGPLDFDYQSAEDLGWRIVKDILEAANTLIQFIRINYGQHWLAPLRHDDPDPQAFLDNVKARWLKDKAWMPLVVNPHVVYVTGAFIGGKRQYFEVADWETIRGALARGESPSEAYSLVSDAKQRFEDGDEHIAVLHLNSAMEAAVGQFIRDHIGPKIPAPSLEKILRDGYDRQLTNWVLPLSDELNLDLRDKEWTSIKKIQDLRRESGHPQVVRGIATLTDADWTVLVNDAISAIAKLTGTPQPKSPRPMAGELQAGTD